MMYSFRRSQGQRAAATSQYFEMFGNRALYKDGWIAICPPRPAPMGDGRRHHWTTSTTTDGSSITSRERLQRSTTTSPRQISTRSSKNCRPTSWVEAKKYDVLPLDDRFI